MTALLRRAWILVAIVAILPFAQTLPNPPVLDDGWAVVDNPLVQGGSRTPPASSRRPTTTAARGRRVGSSAR